MNEHPKGNMKNTMMQSVITSVLILLSTNIFGFPIEFITSDQIITPELSSRAIIRREAGFERDFLILHCLVKKIAPKNLFEVGTCQGYGTLIITNACPACQVISLDLPPNSPPFFLKPSDVGSKCINSYLQVFGDSLTYDYARHFPIDAWFIDGAHDYEHVKFETEQAVSSDAILIVYHDTDIPEVLSAITDVLTTTEYKIYRITDSRISYAIKIDFE